MGAAPKPLAHLSEARPAQTEVAKPLTEARRLIGEKKYAEARERLAQPFDDARDDARRLRLQAESWRREGRQQEAAESLKAAYARRPTSRRVVAGYLYQLRIVGCYLTALAVYGKLPKREKHRQEVAYEMYRLYRELGWTGHADRIHADAGVTHSRTERLLVLLRWVIRWALLKIEDAQLQRVTYDGRNLASLDKVGYQSIEQRYRVRAEIERAVLAIHRLREYVDTAFLALRITYSTIVGVGLVLFLIFSSGAGGTFVRLVVAVPCAAIVYAAGVVLWDWANTYKGALGIVGSLIIVELVLGFSLVRLADNNFWWLLGFATNYGAIVVGIFVVGFLLTAAAEASLEQWVNRRNARAIVMVHVVDLVTEIADPVNRSSRAYLCWKLEAAARTLERDVPRQMPWFDERTTTWFERQCAGAAASMRHMKMRVLSPSGASWEHLVRSLRQQLAALANENWRSLVYRQPPAKPVKSRKDVLKYAVRLAVVALLPVASLYTIGPWLDFGGDALKWARIVSFAWAVLSILFALDPTIREKVETARDIVSSARGSGDTSRPDAARAAAD